MTKKLNELTPMQRSIYLYLKDYVEIHNYAPSVRDIGRAVGISSTSTVYGHLVRLEQKGVIRRGAGKSRAIEILDDDRKARARSLTVPLINDIKDFKSMYVDDNINEYLALPKYIVADENSFALIVNDQSMTNLGFNTGDFIVAKEQNYAFDGDIVVAMLGGNNAMIKTYYLEGKNTRLQPENDAMNPIIVPNEKVEVLGKVTALMRRIR